MEIKISGFDEVKNHLNKLTRELQDIGNKKNIPFDELFPNSFLVKFTSFSSVNEMISNCGYNVKSMEDLENIPEKEWDDYIAKNTRFNNWEEMMKSAMSDWTARKLGF